MGAGSEDWRVYLIGAGGMASHVEAAAWAARESEATRTAVAAGIAEKRQVAVVAERRVLTLRSIEAHERALSFLVALTATDMEAPTAARLDASARLYGAQADATHEAAEAAEAAAASASQALHAATRSIWYSTLMGQVAHMQTQIASAKHWVDRATAYDPTDLPLMERQGVALSACKAAQRAELLTLAIHDLARRQGYDFELAPLLKFDAAPAMAPAPDAMAEAGLVNADADAPAAPPPPKRGRGRPRRGT